MARRRGKVRNRRPPTKRQQREKARLRCQRKVRHATRAAAKAAKVDMRKRGRPVGKLEVYECEVCGGFHLGARP